jgi:hypothetical protein
VTQEAKEGGLCEPLSLDPTWQCSEILFSKNIKSQKKKKKPKNPNHNYFKEGETSLKRHMLNNLKFLWL